MCEIFRMNSSTQTVVSNTSKMMCVQYTKSVHPKKLAENIQTLENISSAKMTVNT